MGQLYFTILETEQIFGNNKIIGNKQLDVFKKYGVTASKTDYSILLSGYTSDDYKIVGFNLKNRNGWYWTKTPYNNSAHAVSYDGNNSWTGVKKRFCGCRPVSLFSSISEISSTGVRGKKSLVEVEYGEYPQKVTSKKLQLILEKAYQSGSLKQTGKSYTVDSRRRNEYDADFVEQKYDEFVFQGKKYVRVIANICFNSDEVILSNGEKYKDVDAAWVEVSPIKWLVDKKAKIMVSKHILFSGIQFNDKEYDGDFSKTSLKWYLDNFFSKEIIPSVIKDKKEEHDNIETTSEEKIIREIKEQLEKIKLHKNKVNEITARVNTLLDKYDILIKNTSNNPLLVLGDSTLSGLKNKRIIELQEILDDLKKLTSSLKLYYDMRDYIRDLIKIKDREEVELDTELKNDFNAIYNVILPFLESAEQSQIKEMLRKLLWNEYEKVGRIIKQIINNEQLDKETYKNIDELELELRNKLHPILEILNKEVLKRDVSKSILEGTKSIIENNYKVSKNNIISLYINIINELYQQIKNSYISKDNEEQQLIEIVQMNIDTNKDINEIIKQLMVIINNLYNFMFDLQEREEKENIIKKHCIKVRL